MPPRLHRIFLAALLSAACDMPPAEVLEAPRILALRAEPAELTPGEPHVLTALTFEVASELEWSLCPVAWSPTEPLSCPGGGAVTLGRGNPLTVTLPDGLDALWLRAEAVSGEALPAVKRLESGSGAENPPAFVIRGSGDALPSAVGVGGTLELHAGFAASPGFEPERVVVSWYLTAGTLEPRRTVGPDPVTLVAPETPGPLSIIAVARHESGGTAWAATTVEVVP